MVNGNGVFSGNTLCAYQVATHSKKQITVWAYLNMLYGLQSFYMLILNNTLSVFTFSYGHSSPHYWEWMENLSQQVWNEISILNNDTRFKSVLLWCLFIFPVRLQWCCQLNYTCLSQAPFGKICKPTADWGRWNGWVSWILRVTGLWYV